MNYLFEQLGDERFQQLAQAVLAKAFPKVQCLPVGMPDGGRDALLRIEGSSGEFYVFQVKFSREPSLKSEREAVEALVRSEKKKVDTLRLQGATAYYFLTNVVGTSHPDTGSIDRVNAVLSNEFGIPSYCWWRDDLSARLDDAKDIKWSYPEVLRGTDIIQIVAEEIFKSRNVDREQALKSYIAHQHSAELEVKFKQVELKNKLLDLYVDIPAHISEGRRGPRFDYYYGEDSDRAGDLLLGGTERVALHFDLPSKLVLEGAPGQGKSTVTQYLCQVHRIRLLGFQADEALIPSHHRSSTLRIPFRVDLRDYATWLSGHDPFGGNQKLPDGASKPLETFVSQQVSALSGGQTFTATDFVGVVKNAKALLVLDGFDEVADIGLRKLMVQQIGDAASRLTAQNAHFQVIVTSRPAAFANSPGFPRGEWTHLELGDLALVHINQYAMKWMAARDLPNSEAKELLGLLREKLEQPHLRDLSRNPMQLAILLALIHTSGLSLPDKRTFLYDSYMKLFFDRESEKSYVVRDHRDLLQDIHKYLGWHLHVVSESKRSSGNISSAELRKLVGDYLAAEGHDAKLVDTLFTGLVERVVALVSRVQGTYEFEVQPIREYFAARYLYDTAPYSPAGMERSGTKPDRLAAIARNFYWLNVTRFYCGCYSKGELADLTLELDQLGASSGYAEIPYPRTLALMLLGDWVFSQQPTSVSAATSIVTRSPGFASLLLGNEGRSRIDLPARCGRAHIASALLKLLSIPGTPRQTHNAALRSLRKVTAPDEREAWWRSHSDSRVADASQLGLLNGWSCRTS